MTLSLPRDLSGTESTEKRHLIFEDLVAASKTLCNLIEDFERLFGKWVTDLEVEF